MNVVVQLAVSQRETLIAPGKEDWCGQPPFSTKTKKLTNGQFKKGKRPEKKGGAGRGGNAIICVIAGSLRVIFRFLASQNVLPDRLKGSVG